MTKHTLNTCGIHTARFLKCFWPFFNSTYKGIKLQDCFPKKTNIKNLITVVELDEVIAERREDIMHLLYIGKGILIKPLFRSLQG